MRCPICDERCHRNYCMMCDTCYEYVCEDCVEDFPEFMTSNHYKTGKLTLLECLNCTKHWDYIEITDEEIYTHILKKYNLNLEDLRKELKDKKLKEYRRESCTYDCTNVTYVPDSGWNSSGYHNCMIEFCDKNIEFEDICDNCLTRTKCRNCNLYNSEEEICDLCYMLENKTNIFLGGFLKLKSENKLTLDNVIKVIKQSELFEDSYNHLKESGKIDEDDIMRKILDCIKED